VNVVGLDLSLTSTGVAITDGALLSTSLIRTKATGVERLMGIRRLVYQFVNGAELVVMEGYAFNRGNQAHQIGELGGVVKVMLHEEGIPVVLVPPARLKMYATGKGNARKEHVLVSAVSRFSRTFDTTDEAEAWWLMAMALDHYGEPVIPMPKANREVLDKIEWPSLKGKVT